MNGWFPRLRFDGAIASGNAGIWLTAPDGAHAKLSDVGIGPVWANIATVYNRNDGTTQVGSLTVPKAYNDYRGSTSGNWAGFAAVGLGRLDRYNSTELVQSVTNACTARFGGPLFGYLSPWQTAADGLRALIIEGSVAAIGIITDWAWERHGAFHVYVVATGTYTKSIKDPAGNNISIRADENPIAVFMAPDGTPWLVTGTSEAITFVRPYNSPMGYAIHGDLYYPDALMLGDRLRVVGSLADGTPRFNEWIDFTKPRIDLRAAH